MTGTRNLKIWLTICSFLLALVSTATGATLYVNTDGSGGAYTSIQEAINAAVWDQIEVAPGTYNEAINFHGKAIRVYSSSGNPADTIINGTGHYHVVQCVNGEGPGTKLEGFTITGGNATGPLFPADPDSHRGGGMYIKGSSPTVLDCVFSDNTAGLGGGMYNKDSSPTLTNCTFRKNVATGVWPAGGQGGGMANSGSSPTLTKCTFRENEAKEIYWAEWVYEFGGKELTGGLGGGMYNHDSSPTVTDCTFIGNNARGLTGEGGGMYNGPLSSAKVTKCKFTGNSASLDGGGGMCNANSSPTVTNCTFSGTGSRIGMVNDTWSSPTVTDCAFSGTGWMGMYNKIWSSPTVTHCSFIDNPYGMYNYWWNSVTVMNCTFTENHNGMWNQWSSPTVTNCRFTKNVYGMNNWTCGPKLTNCTMTGNDVGMDSAFFGMPKLTNCIVWNNRFEILGSADVTYSNVGDDWYSYSGPGNINKDPKFADDDGRLSPDSPCIDAGNNSAISGVATDLDGNGRIVDGNFDGYPVVDMGAYEAYEMLNTIHVPGDCATIQLAIDLAITYSSQIEVAPGTYNEAINFKGKAIRLYSTGGPQVTTINGTGKGYHVVQCVSGEFLSTTLEGFTITGGNANGSPPHNRGGGMYNDDSAPTVTNCIFTGNTATYGGGMSNDNWSWPLITGCTFKGNFAGNAGGGMANSYNYSGVVTDCTFEFNTASVSGGGMWNERSTPRVTNCTFNGNRANALFGGGMHNELFSTVGLTNCTFSSNSAGQRGGGMNNYYQSKAILTNCTFIGNSAEEVGGGMYNWIMQSEAILTNCTFTGNSVPFLKTGGAMGNLEGISILTNCTFTGNSGAYGGGGIHNLNGSATLTNCILWGDSPPEIRGSATVTYSDVQGGWSGTGNINANPKFADADGRLSPGSPCIDTGNNAAVSGVATDLDGNPRKTDGNLDGVAVVDMGAYEHVSVDADADGIEDSVDTEPLVYSNDFSDGSTTGTIIDRADQLLVIADAPAWLGVTISASGGTKKAHVKDSEETDYWLDDGDVVFVTCGSVEITVVQGTVEIVFTGADGTTVRTSLNAGNSIAFEPDTCEVMAPATNVHDVVVIVNGREIILSPGESEMVGRGCWALNVGMTSATLCGMVIDGGPWQYRFRYCEEGGADCFTPWSADFKAAGESFCQDISGLSPGTKYYFSAQVRNSAGESSVFGGSFTTLDSLLQLETPNGGQTVLAGSRCLICWKAEPVLSGRDVLVEYSTDNGSSWNTIDIVANGDAWRSHRGGYYSWYPPAVSSDECLVRISDTSDPSIFDVSDSTFSIVILAVPDVVGLAQADAESAISSAGLVVGTITYVYDNAVAAGEVMGQHPAAGTPVAAGSAVNLTISAGPFAAGPPSVDTEYAINIGASSATVRGVITDDGGACCQYRFWYHEEGGDHYEITPWSSEFKTAGESFSQDIDGLTPGTKYYFWAQVKNSEGESDRWPSSRSFRTLDGLLQLQTPNGGTFSAGSRCLICWKADAAVSDVLVEYSTDNGGSWSVIDTVANGDAWRSYKGGYYSWYPPAVSSDECLVRISDTSDASIFDVSESSFSIVP